MSNMLRQMKKRAKRWKELKNQLEQIPQTRKAMTYQCERCGKSWRMWLQTGLEEHGENHKPVPFIIRCKCGGMACHVRWNEDIQLLETIPIEGYMNYFANVTGMDCGKPVLR